jgi:hypothetical protein
LILFISSGFLPPLIRCRWPSQSSSLPARLAEKSRNGQEKVFSEGAFLLVLPAFNKNDDQDSRRLFLVTAAA